MLPLGFASVGITLLSWFGVEQFALWGDQLQTPKEVITPELSSFISHIVEENKIPGLTLGIVHSNGTVEQAAWGIKSEEGEDMTVDTLFTLASCSKAFVSSTVGILMDDFANGKNVTALPSGLTKFDWDTKVVDILPDEWQLMDEWANSKANIRDILTHVSGLPRHDYSVHPEDSPLDVVLRMRHLRPAFELRAHWNYNNLMYMLSSYLVTKYSGMPYTEYIKERIFVPLNMSSTTYSPSEAIASGKATENWTAFGRRIPWWFTDDQVSLNAGPGGVISSVPDLVKWVKMWLNDGINPDTNTTVVPKSVVDETTTAHSLVTGKSPSAAPYLSLDSYALGWERQSYKGHEVVSHSGGIPGISTRVAFLPNDDLGVIILANADAKARPILDVLYKTIDQALGLDSSVSVAEVESKPKREPVPRAEISSAELEVYAGTYFNAGYGKGNLTLCTQASDSKHCKQVINDFSSFPKEGASSLLYASLPTIWSSHARLQYAGNDTFNNQITYLFPNGYGKDKSPFEANEEGESEGTVRFVVNRVKDSNGVVTAEEVLGFGLFDTVGAVTDREKKGGSIEETADVWFEKVQ